MKISNFKFQMLFVFILAIGVFLRFYNLNWGAPFYFHPDERNIASSVVQLRFPKQLNPHFFAYGSFPIYIVYATGIILNFFSSLINQKLDSITRLSFEQAIFIGRFYSAFFSVLLLLVMYHVGKLLKNQHAGFIALVLSITSVGLIQYAHFGTFEMWLAFFSLLLFLSAIHLWRNYSIKSLVIHSLIFGMLASIKISSLAFLPLSIFLIVINQLKEDYTYSSQRMVKKMVVAYLHILFFVGISFLFFLATNPYTLLDTSSFISSIKYESSVALGTLPVFYTGGFYQTIPIIFQFTKVFPFLINPLLTIIFVPSFAYIMYQTFARKNAFYFLLSTFYLLLFLSQAFFFAKWIRYMVPTLPFMYLMISIGIVDFLEIVDRNVKKGIASSLSRRQSGIRYYVLSIIFITSIVFITSYFVTVSLQEDTRIAAAYWAKDNISFSSRILSEVYDLGIIPFNPSFSRIDLFNFYDLDQNLSSKSELSMRLPSYDYIILPSQRILRSRLLNLDKFPEGSTFYRDLFSEKLGFEKIYETPCNFFCKITYMGDPIFNIEETADVFDRPTVFIFRRK